ncbi:hypothetical protein EVAR_45049_1 [Eumeta japonica]|uniref:Uncharacterized protein n=1 Tax=Eumeta variegata TaxID=151549 RepID=A0A4C1SD73_EUMVA|nr:hypothetical protein EVAR_45049_1 [Eumeta japonica]
MRAKSILDSRMRLASESKARLVRVTRYAIHRAAPIYRGCCVRKIFSNAPSMTPVRAAGRPLIYLRGHSYSRPSAPSPKPAGVVLCEGFAMRATKGHMEPYAL